MSASPEMISAFESMQSQMPTFDGVTGIDIGFRDEDARDANDLAVRVFVADEASVPSELQQLLELFDVPIVVSQRIFRASGLPDKDIHRPVLGGVSVSAARFANGPQTPVGTLGAIARTTRTDPERTVGLSNWHVLAHDANRLFGQEIIQPEPSLIGRLPGDHIGQLLSWSFPESVYSGVADAAICSVEPDALFSVAELGVIAGTTGPTIGMLVQKRGRSTGLTHGIITTDTDSQLFSAYYVDYSDVPAVNNPITGQSTTRREFRNQVQVMCDFPQTIVWSDVGDSGSTVVADVNGNNFITGLHFAHGSRSLGDPISYGIMTPISVLEQELGLAFTQ